ncbi:hypothetical protein ACMT1E_14490 [Sphingomonas flavalba]|uniref:hypothetical protein n=1 Tax=Sphingomonas flavalba TaxID=2559804 RepID=UPI0039E1BE12
MKKLGTVAAALAAFTMSAAPALAAVPTSASRLSVAQNSRVAAATDDSSKLAGGALIGIALAVAAVVAVIVIASDDDKPASA